MGICYALNTIYTDGWQRSKHAVLMQLNNSCKEVMQKIMSKFEKAIEAYVEGMENKECSEALVNVQQNKLRSRQNEEINVQLLIDRFKKFFK